MRRQLGNILPSHIEEELFSGLKRDSFARPRVGHCGAALALLRAFQRKWPFKTKHFSFFLLIWILFGKKMMQTFSFKPEDR